MDIPNIKQMNGEKCPICGQPSRGKPVECGQGYTIYRCPYCDGDFTHVVHSPGMDYHQAYAVGGGPILDIYKSRVLLAPEKELKRARFNRDYKCALRLIEGNNPAGDARLLDIGCSIGVFPKLAKELGVEVYALDTAEEAIRYGRENFGLKNTIVGTIDDIPANWKDFDFITCFQVLEHIDEPLHFIEKIYKLLKAGGYFIMSVPNRNRLSVKLRLRDKWDYPPHHLTRWSKASLEFSLDNLGFTNRTVKIKCLNPAIIASVLLRHKIGKTVRTEEARKESWGFSLLWQFIYPIVDILTFPLQITLGNLYGGFLIAWAQKPD